MKNERLFATLEEPRLDELLSDWQWLVKDNVSLVTITAIGDMVLKKEDGSVWFLDVLEGKFEQISDDLDGYQELLGTKEFRRRNLQYYCILCLVDDGILLKTNECYSPDIPPHLGGELDEKNLKPTDIYVHFSISGQIWEQTKDLKPGTKIDRVNVEYPMKGLFRGIYGRPGWCRWSHGQFPRSFQGISRT